MESDHAGVSRSSNRCNYGYRTPKPKPTLRVPRIIPSRFET